MELADEKLAAKLQKHLLPGRNVLIGEAKKGIVVDAEAERVEHDAQGVLELWVPVPRDPSLVPYAVNDKGRTYVAHKEGVVVLPGKAVQSIRFFDRKRTLRDVAADYVERKAQGERLVRERDACDKASTAWFAAHKPVLADLDVLRTYLRNHGCGEAAEAVGQEIERQRTAVVAEAQAQRVAAAKDSVHAVETPADLIEASQRISGGALQFHVHESRHIRMVHLTALEDERARDLLVFAEGALDAFRRECVDPYLSEAFVDYIPPQPFMEVFLGPTDDAQFEKFLTDYHHIDWGVRMPELIQLGAVSWYRGRHPAYLTYRKLILEHDLKGIMVHLLGHALAEIHYDRDRQSIRQDWLKEAVGYFVSLEALGRNTMYCVGFLPQKEQEDQSTRVGTAKKREAEARAELRSRQRSFLNDLALKNLTSIEQIAQKPLAELSADDLAKAWSFYDYLVKQCGHEGHLLLRSACQSARRGASFLLAWRLDASILFNLPAEKALGILEERWREYAQKQVAAPPKKPPR